MSEPLGFLFLFAAILLGYFYVSLRSRMSEQVHNEVIRWRNQELSNQKQQLLQIARDEARVELEQWKAMHETELRQDAIQRSQAVTIGKVTEHIVPYLPGFSFNPKDVRFLGTPIDLVVFDGLGDGDLKRIVFVEVKTGSSALSGRERLVREAVHARNVEWLEFRPNLQAPDLAAGTATPNLAPPTSQPSTKKRWWQ